MHFSAFMRPARLSPLSDITTKLNHKWHTQSENTHHFRCLNSLPLLAFPEDLCLGVMLTTLHAQKWRSWVNGLVLGYL